MKGSRYDFLIFLSEYELYKKDIKSKINLDKGILQWYFMCRLNVSTPQG